MSVRADDESPTSPGLPNEIGDALERWAKHIDKLVNGGEIIAFPGRTA